MSQELGDRAAGQVRQWVPQGEPCRCIVHSCHGAMRRPPSVNPLHCRGFLAPRRAPAQTAVLVKRLRQALDALLGRKVRQPGLRLEEAGGSLVQSIVDLLNHEEAAQRWDR